MSDELRNEKAAEIGQRIAQARLEQGRMAQRELAELIGVSERSVQAYEAGEVIPYRFMKALETALHKPVAWILHGDEGVTAPDEALQLVLKELKLLRRDVRKLLDQQRAAEEGDNPGEQDRARSQAGSDGGAASSAAGGRSRQRRHVRG